MKYNLNNLNNNSGKFSVTNEIKLEVQNRRNYVIRGVVLISCRVD